MRTISKVVIHHSATPSIDLNKAINSFNNTHKQRLHPRVNKYGLHIAYHYVVDHTGDRQKTRGLEEIGFHASNGEINQESVGICVVGSFDNEEPTEAQYNTVKYIISELKNRFPDITVHKHHEFANYKTCPGAMFNMDKILSKEKLSKKDIAIINKLMKANSKAREMTDNQKLRAILSNTNNQYREILK